MTVCGKGSIAPVFTVPSDKPDGIPDLALYPVCFDAADTRCAEPAS